MKVEWPTGVPQASDKDLAKMSHTEGVGIHFFSGRLVCVCLPLTLIIISRGFDVKTNLHFGRIKQILISMCGLQKHFYIKCKCSVNMMDMR